MLSFERAIDEDYEVLSHIIHAAFSEDKRIYGSGPELYETPEKLLDYISCRRVWTIREDSSPIGCLVVFIQRGGSGVLGCIAIHPDYQNRGIGTKSLEWLESQYKAVRIWRLDTPSANVKARHFYEKCGYIISGEAHDGIDLTLYEKNLDIIADDPNGGCLYKDIVNLGYEAPYTETVAEIQNIRTERMIWRGQTSPDNTWIDHDDTLHILIISGHAYIDIEGKVYELRSGDWRCIHPHQKYRFTRTSREPACLCHVVHIGNM